MFDGSFDPGLLRNEIKKATLDAAWYNHSNSTMVSSCTSFYCIQS